MINGESENYVQSCCDFMETSVELLFVLIWENLINALQSIYSPMLVNFCIIYIYIYSYLLIFCTPLLLISRMIHMYIELLENYQEHYSILNNKLDYEGMMKCFLYPPRTKFSGVYRNHSVCPSVCPSVFGTWMYHHETMCRAIMIQIQP